MFLAVASFATFAAGLRLEDLRGIARRMPWIFAAFVIAGLSLIGIPSTAGFVSKWYLIGAAMELGTAGVPLVVIILVSSLMAVVYVWRIVEAACFADDTGATAVTGRDVSPALVAVTWLAAIANVFFGLVPELPLTLSGAAAAELLDHLP
jgi:multicomponent Na+:H+ antiporter subunit D